jgi:hypothetical protein
VGEEVGVWFVDVLLARAQTAIGLPHEAARRLRRLLDADGAVPADRLAALEALAEAYEAMGEGARAVEARRQAAHALTDRAQGEAVVRRAAERALALLRSGKTDAAASAAWVAESCGLAHRAARASRGAGSLEP